MVVPIQRPIAQRALSPRKSTLHIKRSAFILWAAKPSTTIRRDPPQAMVWYLFVVIGVVDGKEGKEGEGGREREVQW